MQSCTVLYWVRYTRTCWSRQRKGRHRWHIHYSVFYFLISRRCFMFRQQFGAFQAYRANHRQERQREDELTPVFRTGEKTVQVRSKDVWMQSFCSTVCGDCRDHRSHCECGDLPHRWQVQPPLNCRILTVVVVWRTIPVASAKGEIMEKIKGGKRVKYPIKNKGRGATSKATVQCIYRSRKPGTKSLPRNNQRRVVLVFRGSHFHGRFGVNVNDAVPSRNTFG